MFAQKLHVSFSYRHILFIIMAGLSACHQDKSDGNVTGFTSTPQEFAVNEASLNEVSGIADSKANPGYLWVEQDSGNPPDIGLLKHDGTFLKNIHLANVVNRDWEDMVLSNGPLQGIQYLYIAETGDNLLVHPDYVIYRLEEPLAAADTVKNIDAIAFYYPDGSHNTEAILVDPTSKDIYLITKTDLKSRIFKLTYPYSTTVMNRAEDVGVLPYNYVTSAAISPAGNGIVIKTYDAIYYYPHKSGETMLQSLSNKPVNLPYTPEPQGEAIVFANNDSGFYTLSEKGLASSVKLYFYKRIK
ncbi:hypothetical protein A3860_16990 [Niastella vici]|uniref:PE-PGRS family protein n=1 Tax=Niastella vici TaxID=1703345 RepID=A0A1V9G424_9BACT|nr:hypothetical protein [Niastella vici]OQP65363.1 hypothetical protein A3860_16990 [Niastella vici]